MISDEQRRRRLAHRHLLLPERRTNDVAAITENLVALHSSDPATVFLSALVRMKTPELGAVHSALYDDRSLVRHHAMRRTLWVMTPPVARLAHGAATAKVARAERARTIRAIDETTEIADAEVWLDAATAEVAAVLDSEGPMTTRAIGKALPHLVMPIRMGGKTKHPATLNAHTKVMQGAGFDARLVRVAPRGDWTNAEYAWSPVESWLGGPIAGLDEVPAAGELLDRWLLRFGPATTTDIKWWFGWTAGLTKKALAAVEAVEVTLESDGAGWLHPADPDGASEVEDPGPWVRLLPGLDPTTMGWKERDWYLDADDVSYLFDRFGNGGPTIWADGRIVGGWAQHPDASIATKLTQPISGEHERLLATAVDDLQVAIGDTIVRPRFPAPVQRDLLG